MRSGRRVSNKDVGLGTTDNFLSDLQAIGLKDVTLLAIRVAQQRDARRTVRIVFDRSDRRRDSLLVALEIDQAQLALVASATKPTRDIARVAASTGALSSVQAAAYAASTWSDRH